MRGAGTHMLIGAVASIAPACAVPSLLPHAEGAVAIGQLGAAARVFHAMRDRQ